MQVWNTKPCATAPADRAQEPEFWLEVNSSHYKPIMQGSLRLYRLYRYAHRSAACLRLFMHLSVGKIDSPARFATLKAFFSALKKNVFSYLH